MAENREKKITMKQTLKLHRRACAMWFHACPDLFVSKALAAASAAVLPYTGIWFSARIIDELSGERNPQRLLYWVLAALGVNAALGLLTQVMKRWAEKNERISYWQEWKFYSDKYKTMDYGYLDDPATKDLEVTISQNRQWASYGTLKIIEYFEKLIGAVITMIGGVSLSLRFFLQKIPTENPQLRLLNSPWLTAAVLAAMAAATLLSSRCRTRAELYWSKSSEGARFGNRVFSYFGFFGRQENQRLDARMYRQDRMAERYMKGTNSFTEGGEMQKMATGPMGGWTALSCVFSSLFGGMVYAVVCLKAWAGAFGIGSVTQYIGAITAFSNGFGAFLGTLGQMKANSPFLENCFAYLDIENDMYRGSLTTEKRSDRRYEIEFRDVTFCYPGSTEPVLEHISVRFEVGKRVAVVGENGSGKTTFIKLLCRLYDPTQGQILLNGIDIRKYSMQDYQSIFSVVFQDFGLLAYPLGENVAAGRAYDRERAKECLCKAGFQERLDTMKEGLDTMLYKKLSPEGIDISGGEAQKIAMARALYKDAPFMILDEPTAALDPLAEAEVYAGFNRLIEDKTAVYISHRLSSCRFCDEILVFDKGKIIQRGTHEGLVNQPGKYSVLWESQAKYYR